MRAREGTGHPFQADGYPRGELLLAAGRCVLHLTSTFFIGIRSTPKHAVQ
jgi:hypothetical protein